ARPSGTGGRGSGPAKRGPKPKALLVPKLPPELVDPALQQIAKRIPVECLATFENEQSRILYASILLKFIEETIPEGSTILQVLVAERAAYYWTVAHAFERNSKKGVTEEYKFYVYEFNRNLEILRGLAIRNLPATQVKLLAKKTINVIERIIKNPADKDKIIKEIYHEFTIEVNNIGFKKESVQLTGRLLPAGAGAEAGAS
ncbi:MAG: hypothetical protein Q8N81_06100, partial [bacterium]|nr:hypothetical protein [bacterium]